MSKRQEWSYALHIKGVTIKTLDMARVGEYLTEFANLLGREARPRFAGIVKGSVVIRAREDSEHPALVRTRLRESANDATSPGHRYFEKLAKLIEHDAARADIVDPSGGVVLHFPGRAFKEPREEEVTINDRGELDGQLVSIVGADDTVHIRLQDVGGVTHKIVVAKLELAQSLAKHFRTGWLRIRVHGTWRRNDEGRWEAHTVYADDFEELDTSPPSDILLPLQGVPGNGWSDLDDPIGEWKRLRGIQ